MAIEVSINEHTKADYFDATFAKFPDLEKSILDDFIRYKSTDELPSYFGCDVAYTQPEGARKSGMMHIHLKLPPAEFPKNKPQADRKCANGDPENDACLVYVRGVLYEDRYSLLAIFNPDAHGIARDHRVMNYLSRVAQHFVDNN
ncbi:type II toxin-antitoxin system YafO family toxin [Rouxiella sp. Mn2063]|uniref:type II toxin-antitoxin system YafO family toxin n=1 Tax=Rouxiella sp. Mn2063 TaxID=3395262 RepID=UPI003BC2969C